MESPRLPTRDPRLSPRGRLWLGLGAALLLGLTLLPWILPFGPLRGDVPGTLAAVAVMGVPAILLAFAARRGDLDPRLRRALGFLAASIGLAVLGNLVRLLSALGVQVPEVPGIGLASNVVIWACGLAALLSIPMRPLGREALWQMGTDTTIAVGGLALAIFAVWTLPGFAHAPESARLQLLAFNLMAAANLVALDLILVRGPSRPLRRAVWLLAATIVIETTYLVAMQYAIGRQGHDFRLPNSLFFVDYLAYLFAATFFLTDRQPYSDLPLLPESVRAFNPLPMAAIIGVSVLLWLSTLHPSDPALFPLALGSSAMALLLLARVVGATMQIQRLARAESDALRRVQATRLQLMGRLAGGIAHVINNLMGVVLVNAELIADAAGPDQDLRSGAADIGASARLASGLAARLLLASGQRPRDDHLSTLLEVVQRERDAAGPRLAPPRIIRWELDESGGRALVHATAAAAVFGEVLSNALDFTPEGGRITIRVRDETRSGFEAGMVVAPPAGRYSVLEIDDTGCGIAPDALPRACDPFYSTRPLSEGRGLGLSVVCGVMAAASGGLRLDSLAGSGTHVGLYFPLGEPQPDGASVVAKEEPA